MRLAACLLICALQPLPASAEIFRCVDAAGKVTFSLTPPTTPCHARRGAAPTRAAATPSPSSPADFPRVDVATQQSRDAGRRQILEDELAAEMQLRKLANAEDVATHHDRNILALRKEISFLR